MKYPCRSIFGITLLAILSACRPSPETTQSTAKIIGGRSVSPQEWPTVVAITERQGLPFGFPSLSIEEMGILARELLPTIKCTGTAISPRIIITAAHCFVSLTSLPDGPVTLGVHVGSGVEGGKFEVQDASLNEGDNSELFEIESKGIHPNYFKKDNLGYDIAYVILKKPLTLPESAYIRVLTDADEKAILLESGRTVTAVGFGARSPARGEVPTGVKQEGQFTLFDALSEIDALDESGRSTHIPWNPKAEIVVKDKDKGSCRGDSGGPLFGQLPNGDWRLFGVVSRAYNNGTCASYATIYGLLPESICWVQSQVNDSLGLPEGYCL